MEGTTLGKGQRGSGLPCGSIGSLPPTSWSLENKSLALFTQETERLTVIMEQVRWGGQSLGLGKVTLMEQALKGTTALQ